MGVRGGQLGDMEPRHPACAASVPSVWVLLGTEPGDNAQLRILAEALGWPFEERRLVFRRVSGLHNLLLSATLAGLAPPRPADLAPPWPDLILACGKRSVPVARWIQRRSAGRTRLVHCGRPWAPLAWFDLVLTTPHYALPERENVLVTALPFHRISPATLAAAADRWRERLLALPPPRIAVLLGGPARPFVMNTASLRAIAERVGRLARTLGGSLMVTTSPRTPSSALTVVRDATDVPTVLHRWRAGDPDNPYAAFLALADRVVVTEDSVAMLAEACRTGAPVTVARLATRRSVRTTLVRLLDRTLPAVQRRLTGSGLLVSGRDVRRIHERLHCEGCVDYLDAPASGPRIPFPDELPVAVAAIRRLLGKQHTGPAPTSSGVPGREDSG